eukprot:TRINITY_DN52357_c0_g1_i1.p2 TRINITY_DN52357_c0_g1~~TRINITY_DN52357_c0_g1_i1.p2  ORF type:complete len:105 (+),score=3.95 TRINITY_DN52357_c0_g1_i1:210-524(+)
MMASHIIFARFNLQFATLINLKELSNLLIRQQIQFQHLYYLSMEKKFTDWKVYHIKDLLESCLWLLGVIYWVKVQIIESKFDQNFEILGQSQLQKEIVINVDLG